MNENDTRDSPSDSSDDDLDLETLYEINEKENWTNEDSITVQQLRSVSMFRVPILIQGVKTFAVVDTAAEVTIISDKLYESLEEKPKMIKEVVMNTAGRDLKMKAHMVFPVRLKLGEKVYEEQIYVAPIEDEMLLGIDFLEKHKADIDICERQLKLDGITLPMQLSSDGATPKVACVVLNRRTVIAPNSIVVGSVYSLSLDGKATCSNEAREIEVPDGKAQPGFEGQFGYMLPWDPGGCWDSPDTQSDVVHVDIVTTDKTPEVIVSKPSISFPGYTRKEIREKQKNDSDVQIILAWLEKGEVPEEGTVFSASPASKYYWINKEVFEIVQGTLCKKKRVGQLDLVIPDSLKAEVLKTNHDIPMAWHQGMDRAKVKEFRGPQIEELKKVPLDRILLEADSSHLPSFQGLRVNSPGYVGEIAKMIARHVGASAKEILQASVENARELCNF